ncbi:MAG: hypothetical protein KAT71_08015, partial [Gammaproteobacteria bacterium]|nr:hypothetical protein [Gammaproteobacteria bacterium]
SGIISLTSGLVKGVVALNDFGTSLGKMFAAAMGHEVITNAEIAEKLIGKISKAEAELVRADDPRYREVLEQALDKYKAELAMLNEAQEATATGGLGGEGDQVSSAEGITLAAQSDAEAQLLADALVLQAMMEQEEAKAAIEQQAFDDKMLREALLTQAEQDAADQRLAIAEAEAAGRSAIVNGMMNNLTSLMNSGSKKMFNIGKVAAIASGLLSLKDSVMSAYAAGSKIGGPPLGAAYAATAGLAQAANLAKIKSSSFGGGGGGGATAATSTTGGAPVTGSLGLEPLPTEVVAPVKHELVVAVEGESANSDAMRKFITDMESTLEDMGSDTRLVLA